MSETKESIQITLNGKPNSIQAGMTVSDLLLKWKIRPELVTVEINETILQKLDYESTRIQEGDKIEFVFYMGGGTTLYWQSAEKASDARRGPKNAETYREVRRTRDEDRNNADDVFSADCRENV